MIHQTLKRNKTIRYPDFVQQTFNMFATLLVQYLQKQHIENHQTTNKIDRS